MTPKSQSEAPDRGQWMSMSCVQKNPMMKIASHLHLPKIRAMRNLAILECPRRAANIKENENHEKYTSKPPEIHIYRQSSLVLTPQSLGYWADAPPQRRTQAPNAIKRITHAPFFSTVNRQLTSLLRLPYNVRLQIYLYLLRCGEMQYQVCLDTSRLVIASETGDRLPYPYLRHGLFPSILETCRLVNAEASPILYASNSCVAKT